MLLPRTVGLIAAAFGAVDLVCLGTGNGSTAVFDGEPSSALVIRISEKPVLLLDLGFGVTRAAQQWVGGLPQAIYISHNHSDHAAELPTVLGAGAAEATCKRTVIAEENVLNRLQNLRCAELMSTGRPLAHFAGWQGVQEGSEAVLPFGLTVRPVRSHHSELCFGAVISCNGHVLLGWSADSAYDEGLYQQLAPAAMVVLHGRRHGSMEHASFQELNDYVHPEKLPGMRQRTFITHYGRQQERQHLIDYDLQMLWPGRVVPLTIT